jgi:hypothetical protein
VLDVWCAGSTEERSAQVADLDERAPGARVQVTAWVLPSTARELFSFSIEKPIGARSLSHNAALIIERWAAGVERGK